MIDMTLVKAVVTEICCQQTLEEGQQVAHRIADAAEMTIALIGRILSATGIQVAGMTHTRDLESYKKTEDAYSRYREKLSERYR